MGSLHAGSPQIKKGTQGITFHFFGGVSLQGHQTLTDSKSFSLATISEIAPKVNS